MDKTYYKTKILELLSDTENYIPLSENEDDSILRKIKKLIKEYEKHFTKNEKDYIINFLMRTSYFYGLPKIHKSKVIKDAVKEQDSD